jgi:hypothetical protein
MKAGSTSPLNLSNNACAMLILYEVVKFDHEKKTVIFQGTVFCWRPKQSSVISSLCRTAPCEVIVLCFANVEVPFRYVFVQMQKELSWFRDKFQRIRWGKSLFGSMASSWHEKICSWHEYTVGVGVKLATLFVGSRCHVLERQTHD